MSAIQESDLARLRRRIEDLSIPEPNTGCWLWTRWAMPRGYGRLYVGNRQWLAHRVSSWVFNGPYSENLAIMHECDTPACVNPEHLRPGTNKENVDHRVKMGRTAILSGSQNPYSKLTESVIRRCREDWHAGLFTYSEMARRYGVSKTTMARAVKGQRWKHV